MGKTNARRTLVPFCRGLENFRKKEGFKLYAVNKTREIVLANKGKRSCYLKIKGLSKESNQIGTNGASALDFQAFFALRRVVISKK